MSKGLAAASTDDAQARARQEELFAYTIDLGDRPASERAADAILQAISSRADR